MNRPSFQFYPGDWLRNANLRRCSHAARGAWIDILCLLHDSEEYGVLRWPLADISQASGVPVDLLVELAGKGVLKGGDGGCDGYVYRAMHAGKEGDPFTLIEPCTTPCWYSSRFVRDDHVRKQRGKSTQFSPDNQPNKQPTGRVGDGKGVREGDGASTALAFASALAVSTASKIKSSPSDLSPATAADPVGQKETIPYQAMADLYNRTASGVFPAVTKLTDKRRKAVKRMWLADTDNENENRRTNSLDYWGRYFAHCATGIEFFRKAAAGENRGEHAGWVPGFDYLMREDTWLGVREGRFK